MSDSAVGFSFQADVVGVGSVTHLVAGRMLKMLSDAKVDPYSVAASIWLGKKIKVRSELEVTVHPYLEARSKQGLQGFLIKALSIGWGHSEAAVELCRTQAGTNAILLIGALATGSPPFWAAQCLSELLSNYGCEADQIPNVDHLKTLVSYLAPIIQDVSGFSKVLQHILTTIGSVLCHLEHEKYVKICYALKTMGKPGIIAAAIKQLVFTSQRDESFYFVVEQMGAWFAAFSSHIIGMSVQLLVGDHVVWETGGSNGRAIFQLIGDDIKDKNVKTVLQGDMANFMLVNQPLATGQKPHLSIDYALKDICGAVMTDMNNVYSSQMVSWFPGAVARLSILLLQRLEFKEHIQDNFRGGRLKALLSTLSDLDISEELIRQALRWTTQHPPGNLSDSQMDQESRWEYLEAEDIERLHACCSVTRHDGPHRICPCYQFDELVVSLAVLAHALSRCYYQPEGFRIKAPKRLPRSAAVRSSSTKLLEYISYHIHYLSEAKPITAMKENCGREGLTRDWLGISAQNITVFLSCLVGDEGTYDECGRMVTIASGRMTINGALRGLIWEDEKLHPYNWEGRMLYPDGRTKMVNGGLLKCHYRPSKTYISQEIVLGEDEARVVTNITRDGYAPRQVNVSKSLHDFLEIVHIPPACRHSPSRQFRVPDGASIWLSGFDEFYDDASPEVTGQDGSRSGGSRAVVYALKGRKLEQVLQATALFERASSCPPICQLFCCISCAFSFSEVASSRLEPHNRGTNCHMLIMAG
ncbi:hypothetical protein HJFPF1_07040 [Paramyrothecium foliicola]|nr:hypothetical protein HJFPF1_07040 [Paramyrothecium foliicola]